MSGKGMGGIRGTGTTIRPATQTPFSRTANLLQTKFAPVSVVHPPLATAGVTGDRSISGVAQSTALYLTAGGLTWRFANSWNFLPSVSATPFGTPPAAGTTLFISALSLTSVTIMSTSGADIRQVHLIAIGNPN